MKHIPNRYFLPSSLIIFFLSTLVSPLVLTACLGGSSIPRTESATPPWLALSSGRIYAWYASNSLNSNSLAVFRADTGALLWRKSNVYSPFPHTYMQVADATTAYVQTPKALLAIDVESGRERWHVEAQDAWWIYANAVSNGIVYATVSPGNGGDPSLLALEAANGKQIWKTTIAPLDRRGAEDVEVEGDRVYVRAENNFFVLQARDGKVLWSSYATSPIRAGGVVFLTRWRKTGDSIIDAVQEKDGKLLWSFHPPTGDGEPQHAITAGPEDPLVHSIITSNGILGVESQGILYGVNTKNGSLLWSLANKNIDYHPDSLFTANGIIYAQSTDNKLLAIEAKGGAIPWSIHVDGGMGGVTLDSTAGILFVTVVSSGSGSKYVEAVRANGEVFWKMQLQQTADSSDWSDYQIADGRIYQVVASAATTIKDSDIPTTYYKQMNLSATKVGDRTALWSKLVSV